MRGAILAALRCEHEATPRRDRGGYVLDPVACWQGGRGGADTLRVSSWSAAPPAYLGDCPEALRQAVTSRRALGRARARAAEVEQG